jgi:hypothetical protein
MNVEIAEFVWKLTETYKSIVWQNRRILEC